MSTIKPIVGEYVRVPIPEAGTVHLVLLTSERSAASTITLDGGAIPKGLASIVLDEQIKALFPREPQLPVQPWPGVSEE